MKNLCKVIRDDANFLRKHNLMDYSLYLAVENNDDMSREEIRQCAAQQEEGSFNMAFGAEERPSRNISERNQFYSLDGSEVYHIGIIDYLQLWN